MTDHNKVSCSRTYSQHEIPQRIISSEGITMRGEAPWPHTQKLNQGYSHKLSNINSKKYGPLKGTLDKSYLLIKNIPQQ